MKRLILYILILNALWFAPLDRVEIAELEPVRGLWLYREDGETVLETDTGSRGTGETLSEALENMKTTSPGIVYLDTAEYLFVSETAIEEIPELACNLKRSVRMCLWEGTGDMETAIKYANARKLGTKICRWRTSDKLPNLSLQNTAK